MSSRVLSQIARKYLKKGYTVYGQLPGHPPAPEDWAGPFPDMAAVRGEERIAFLSHAHDYCFDGLEPERLEATLQNEGYQVHLISDCLVCTCDIKKRAQRISRGRPGRVLVRRFIRGGSKSPEVPMLVQFGLTRSGLLLLALLLVVGCGLAAYSVLYSPWRPI